MQVAENGPTRPDGFVADRVYGYITTDALPTDTVTTADLEGFWARYRRVRARGLRQQMAEFTRFARCRGERKVKHRALMKHALRTERAKSRRAAAVQTLRGGPGLTVEPTQAGVSAAAPDHDCQWVTVHLVDGRGRLFVDAKVYGDAATQAEAVELLRAWLVRRECPSTHEVSRAG
jgi:hypothetical protein